MPNNIRLHPDNSARAYTGVIGCKATKSDFMLSFGGTKKMDTLDGNNQKDGERKDILDVFLNLKQAEMLYEELGKVIPRFKKDKDGTEV